MSIVTTQRRVESNTDQRVNRRIARRTETNVASCAAMGREAIDARLAELDREWDIERCLETMAPVFTLTGLLLGLTKRRRWFALPFAVQSFFFQHAIQGWCPPIPVLRRLGFRTVGEIEQERTALKALRGDFRHVNSRRRSEGVRSALKAAKK